MKTTFKQLKKGDKFTTRYGDWIKVSQNSAECLLHTNCPGLVGKIAHGFRDNQHVLLNTPTN